MNWRVVAVQQKDALDLDFEVSVVNNYLDLGYILDWWTRCRNQEWLLILAYAIRQVMVHTLYWDGEEFWRKRFAILGNSLAVQQLGLQAFTAKGPSSISGSGTKIPQAAWCHQKKKKKKICHSLSVLGKRERPVRYPRGCAKGVVSWYARSGNQDRNINLSYQCLDGIWRWYWKLLEQ